MRSISASMESASRSVEGLGGLADELADGSVLRRLARCANDPVRFGPALLPDEGHEADLTERLAVEAPVVSPGDPHEHLGSLVRSHRHDQAAARRELAEQRLGDLGPAGRNGDGVVGGMLGPAEGPVAAEDVRVVVPEPRQAFARTVREELETLDGEHLLHEAAQNGRRVAGARPDLEHPLAAPEAQGLDGDRDDVGL